MPKYISIRDAFFFKYKTLTQAMHGAKKMGITNEIFNKLRIKQGIKNWTTCRKEYKINKNKSYFYKEKERIKCIEQKMQELEELQEDILYINNISDIDYIIEEQVLHEYESNILDYEVLNKNNRKKFLLFFGPVVFFNHEKEILHQIGNHRVRHSQQGHLRPCFYGLPFFHLHQPRWSLLQGCFQSR
jgi:hypothetical protein